MNSKFFIVILFILSLVLFACDNKEMDEISSSPYKVGFSAEGIIPTRSATPLTVGETFGVLAYHCPDGTFYPDRSYPDLLYNAYVEKFEQEDSDGGKYNGFLYNPTVHWPTSGKVRFVAYYPHCSSLATGTITVSPFTDTGLPNFEVVLGLQKGSVNFATADVGPISRLVGSDSPETPYRTDNNVSFLFKRRMSYIQFRCKAVGIPQLTRLYVNNITLRNIYRRGTFNMTTEAWEDLSIDATTGATLNISSVTVPVKTDDFADLVDPNGIGYRIAILPQQYDNVEMYITYTLQYMKAEGGCEYQITGTKRIPLSADWKMGKLNIYDIEFAFSEAYGGQSLFNFNVQPWDPRDVNTNM